MKSKLKFAAFMLVVIGLYIGLVATVNHQYQLNKIQKARNIQLVQLVCVQAHQEISRSSEATCSLAQEVTHTEFLCNSQYEDAICWTENK